MNAQPNSARAPIDQWKPHALDKRLNDSERAELVRCYVAGDSSPALAQRFNVSEGAVVNVLRRQGVVIRGNARVTAAQVQQMRRLRERGVTYKAIGDRFGITRTSVAKRLR